MEEAKLLYYSFNDDGELFEHWYDGDVNIKRTREREKICKWMAQETYAQSCGDQEFPVVFHIHNENKKYLGSYKVYLDLEPVFFVSKQPNPNPKAGR